MSTKSTRAHRIYACVHVLNGTAEVWSLRDAELPKGLEVAVGTLGATVSGYWGLMRECYECTVTAIELRNAPELRLSWSDAVAARRAEAELVADVEALLGPVHQPRERPVLCSGCLRPTYAVHGRCDRCGALDCDRCRVEL